MKVWVFVEEARWSAKFTVSVFSTKEKAEAHMKERIAELANGEFVGESFYVGNDGLTLFYEDVEVDKLNGMKF